MKSSSLHVISATALVFQGKTYRCAVGRGGFAAPGEKREGDLKTPTGIWPLRELWYRPDKLAKPVCALPTRATTPEDGWCDDPNHAAYNRPILLRHPVSGEAAAQDLAEARDPAHCLRQSQDDTINSFEHLWREDDVYDLIIPLGYNDAPPVAGKGSAIFMHIAQPDWRGTEGCVALAKEDLLEILGQVRADSVIEIAPQ